MKGNLINAFFIALTMGFYFNSYAQQKNIVETAIATESLSTLVAAVKAGDLVETLSGEGPFTVFAPTNDAFAALPEGTLETLLKPENKKNASIYFNLPRSCRKSYVY